MTLAHAHSIGSANGWHVHAGRWKDGTCTQKGTREVGCMYLEYSRALNGTSNVLKDTDVVTLTARGSLHKYYHGHNAGTFTYAETCKAVYLLAAELKLDPTQAKITRAEIGTNIKTKRLASEYMAAFVAKGPKAFDYSDGHTLRVDLHKAKKHGKKAPYSIKIYDKGREQRDRNTDSGLTGQHLLRLEIVAQAHIYREKSKLPPIRLVDLTDKAILDRMGKRFRTVIARCVVFAPLDIPDPLPASRQVTTKGTDGQRERWNGYDSNERKRIIRKRLKIEAAHATSQPLIEILDSIDQPEPKTLQMSRSRPYDKGLDRDIPHLQVWTYRDVEEWYSIDPLARTPQVSSRIAKGKCGICCRALTGKAESTCTNTRTCRNAKSNSVHDVCRAIARELNAHPERLHLFTRTMIQQRIDNRLRDAHINYRQRPQESEIYGLPLF